MISKSHLSKKKVRALAKAAGAQTEADVALLGRLAQMRHQVSIVADIWGDAVTRATAEKLSLYTLLLKRGRFFREQPLPADFCYGEPNQCYGNSFDLATERPGLAYCEGFAAMPDRAAKTLDFRHAWCVTADGFVIDVTLDGVAGMSYFGMEFTPDEVARFGGGASLPLIDELLDPRPSPKGR